MRAPVVLSIASVLLLAGLTGCNKTQDQPANFADGNPANGNLAPTDQPADQTQQVSTTPPASADYSAPAGQNYYPDSGYTVRASEAPPPLPEYSQPPCPGDDYLWTPGYWDYSDAGYYWVPGAWVMAPWVDALWTPPWWGYDDGVYILHAGYWGPHIGFYGGIDYGFGYTGRGYYGAYWRGGHVAYNSSVTRVNESNVHNVYTYPVAERHGNRASFNGGRGGIEARPTTAEMAVARDPRTAPVPQQVQHARQAASNRGQFAGRGRGAPAQLSVDRPIATSYRSPSARPPAEAMRRATQPPPQTRAQAQPNERPAPQQPQHPEARSYTPPTQPRAQAQPNERPAPQQPQHPEARSYTPPTQHAQAQPNQRPAPQQPQHPEARSYTPPPQPRAQAQPNQRPAPQQPQHPEARSYTPPPQHASAPPQNRPSPPPAGPPVNHGPVVARQVPSHPEPRAAAPPRPAPPVHQEVVRPPAPAKQPPPAAPKAAPTNQKERREP